MGVSFCLFLHLENESVCEVRAFHVGLGKYACRDSICGGVGVYEWGPVSCILRHLVRVTYPPAAMKCYQVTSSGWHR